MLDVCVIIPVRNRPVLLKEALQSVLASSSLPSQIVVIVDGNQNETEPDQKAAEHFSNIFRAHQIDYSILTGAGLGPAIARNTAAARCRCTWIAFLDSDDLWQKHKLKAQIDYMQKRPFLNASHCGEVWLKHGSEIRIPHRLRPSPGRPLLESLDHCIISVSSVLIRRSTFFELGGFDGNLTVCEDYDFWIRYFLRYTMGMVLSAKDAQVIKRSSGWTQLSKTQNIDLYRAESLAKIATKLTVNTDRQLVLEALAVKWQIVLDQHQKFDLGKNQRFMKLSSIVPALLRQRHRT